MKNFINLGKNFSQLKFLAVLMIFTISQAFCQTSTNIATSGTGSIWQDLPSTSSISNVSKSANTGINNGNITTDVVLTDVNSVNNWQAAGVTWASAQNGITSVKFYNGFTSNIANENGIFAAGIKVQTSADGSTWSDVSGWSISPTYLYTLASSNQIYVFSGAALNNVRGIRVVGQLRLSSNEYGTSWALKVKEIEVMAGVVANVAVTSVSVSPTTLTLNIGTTSNLTSTIAPTNATNKNVTWSSNNTSIATVNASGVVTAVAAGSAVITVSTQDGNKTATANITVNAPQQSANIATSGIGSVWQDISSTSSTSDASKSANSGINNGNITTDVVLTDVNSVNNWQAAGVTWATAQNGITSLKFYNGFTADIANDNGIFAAGIKVQTSADGSTWSDVSGWSISPTYLYTLASSNQIFIFSGAALNNVRGIRVVGQLRLSTNEYGTSWALKVKEIEVMAGAVANVAVTSVSVSPTSFTLNIGATTNLTSTIAPTNATNKNVTWSSNNTSIATVNASGVVTAVAAGSAIITATTQDGNKTATANITVNAAANVLVSSVSLSATSMSLNVGASNSLSATVLPSNATNKNVTWSSNNTSIATVNSSGVVTGISVGNAVITVSTQDGNKTATSNVSVTTAPVNTRTNNLGMNMSNPGIDYSTDVVFADAMRSHRYWHKINKVSDDDAPKDANFWPTTDAQCLVWAGAPNTQGTYKLYFTGQATVSTNDGTISNYSYDAVANKSTATVVIASGNSQLYLTFTNTKRTSTSATNTGVINVKLMRPLTPGSSSSYAETEMFYTPTINQLAPFKTIRGLGWTAVNWSQDSVWSDRTLMQHARQSPPKGGKEYGWEGRGASFESLILFANQTQKDVWLNIPHKATDDYITKLAQLFKFGSNGVTPYTSLQANPVYPPLNSNLKLYLEYSNEIWNDQFSQTGWTYEKSKTVAAVKFDGSTDQWEWGMRYKAFRTVQISILFRNVFTTDMMTKIRPVICSQKGYLDRTIKAYSFIDRYFAKRDSRSTWNDPHPVNYYLYGAGSSFYWYAKNAATLSNIWTNGSWDATASFPDPWGNPAGFYDNLHADAAWANQYGLAFVNYEGDSHPNYDGDEAVIKAIHTGTWDLRFKQNTLDHLNVLNQVGAELSCFLVLNGTDGSEWAVRNYNNPSNSPQLDAINQFNSSTPLAITIGTMAPFTKAGNAYSTDYGNYPNLNGTGTASITANDSYAMSYLMRVPSNGTYNAKIQYSTTAAATLIVEFAGNVIGTYALPNTNGAINTTSPAVFTANANALYSVRVVAAAGSITIHNVIVGNGATNREEVVENSSDLAESSFINNDISMHPNPATHIVNINTGNKNGGTIYISDMEGKLLKNISTNEQINSVSITDLASGIYLVTIKTENSTDHKKLIVD